MNQRGVERWVYELASRISSKNEVSVFQNKPLGTSTGYKIVATDIIYSEKKKQNNRFLKHLFIDYDSLKILRFTFKIIRVLFKKDFDIVIPTDGGWEPAIIRLITWIKRKKMIIVGHAGIGWDDMNNLWSFPDVFVALSSYAKQWAKKVNPVIRIEYIPDGVDTKKFTAVGKQFDLHLEKPVAICVAALEEGKRIDLIIKAVAEVKDLSLLICGRGEIKENIYGLGNKLLKDRFMLNEFSFGKMPDVYRSCNLLLSASLPYYSFEMVLLEGLASGLPVVANDDPIRREIVGDAGIFVDCHNTKAFSEAIKSALRKKWGNEPSRQAQKYSWGKVINMYVDLFNNLLKK